MRGVDDGDFSVGVSRFKLLNRLVHRVESAAHFVRESDVDNVLAAFQHGLEIADIVRFVERAGLCHRAAAHSVEKCTVVGILAEVVIIFLAAYRIGHRDVVDSQLFYFIVPQFAVAVAKKSAHCYPPKQFNSGVFPPRRLLLSPLYTAPCYNYNIF